MIFCKHFKESQIQFITFSYLIIHIICILYIFIKTLVLWKRNVSIVATPFVVAPIRNSALISAETTTTTG